MLRLSQFAASDVPLCGVLVFDSSALDLSSGSVRGCPIGACVQTPGYDLARLSRDVVYLDNGRPLDTTMLPLPPIASSLMVR